MGCLFSTINKKYCEKLENNELNNGNVISINMPYCKYKIRHPIIIANDDCLEIGSEIMILNRRNDIFIICPFNKKRFFNNQKENVVVRRINENICKRLIEKEHENSYRINCKYINKEKIHIQNINLMKDVDEYINKKEYAVLYILCSSPFYKTL